MLQSRLPAIAANLKPRIEAALKIAAEQIASDAKGRVPVNSGDLRDAIHVEETGPAEYTVIAGSDKVFYGHLVEFGTSHSGAQPFLIPAAEAGVEEAVKLVRTAVMDL